MCKIHGSTTRYTKFQMSIFNRLPTVARQKTLNLVKYDERYRRIDACGYKSGGELSREPQKMHEKMTMHLVDNRLVRAVVAISKFLTHYLIE